jgi:hypothetical protein
VRFGACRDGCDLLAADMQPLDLFLLANRVGESVSGYLRQYTIDALYACHREDFGELLGNAGHGLTPLSNFLPI